MKQHHVLAEQVSNGYQLKEGDLEVRKAFGSTMRYSLSSRFPLDRSGPVAFSDVVAELLWLLNGSTNVKQLNELGSHRLDLVALQQDEIEEHPKTPAQLVEELALKLRLDPRLVSNMLSTADHLEPPSEDPSVTLSGARRVLADQGISLSHPVVVIPEGSVGFNEGVMWRGVGETDCIDQITALIEQLKSNPMNRPHLLNGWLSEKMYKYERGQSQLNVKCGCAAIEPQIPLMQFLVRELSGLERVTKATRLGIRIPEHIDTIELVNWLDEADVPRLALDCCVYQQRGNAASEIPFVTALAALLTELIAHFVDMGAGHLMHFVGEAWLTEEQVQFLDPRAGWEPEDCGHVQISPMVGDIFALNPEDIALI